MNPAADSLSARRAIEALRAGVPNRDAVAALGFDNDELLAAFNQQVTAVPASFETGEQPRGVLLAGEFGAGKSHALQYLSDQALQRNLAVSKVVISKETPLFDPAKLYRSAMETLRVVDRIEGLEGMLLDKLRPRTTPFDEFTRWLHDSGLDARFAATLWLYESAQSNMELIRRLIGFWSGDALQIGQLRRDLKECGGASHFVLGKITAKELFRQRYRFMPRLLRAAGYDGWLVLLDELELVGRYTLLQRGRAYAELTRLLGLAPEDEQVPGLLVIGSITPDFGVAVIRDKDDVNQIRFKFEARGDDGSYTADLAERAMDEIERRLILLPEPDGAKLRATLERLTDIYETAYGAHPAGAGDFAQRPGYQMREHIRSWITSWDLRRLDPTYQSDLRVEHLRADYSEEQQLESAPEDDVETIQLPGDDAAASQ